MNDFCGMKVERREYAGAARVAAANGLSLDPVYKSQWAAAEVLSTPCTLRPTPRTLPPTPYTLHLTPYTLPTTPCTLQPTT